MSRGQFNIAAFAPTVIARLQSALRALAASTDTSAQAIAVASRPFVHRKRAIEVL